MVVHCGRIEMEDYTRRLAERRYASAGNSDEYALMLKTVKRERELRKGPYVEAVCRSLRELVAAATGTGVMIAVENRYYYREIPSFEEIGDFLSEFPEDVLCYWHDFGHAQVAENLGLAEHRGFLERYSGRMLGVYLHDVNRIRDHLPPGQGHIDFNSWKGYIKPVEVKVLEIHQPADEPAVREGIRCLERILQDTGPQVKV